MLRPAVDLTTLEPTPSSQLDESAIATASQKMTTGAAIAQLSKPEIRTSLRASTLDGVFATIFSNIAGGVLLSNFLVELNASPVQLGMLASIPMLANLLQPLGAYFADRTTSRHDYSLWIYAPSRLLWLILVLGIAFASLTHTPPQALVLCTLGVMVLSHFLGALGSASWLSWLAALVPPKLRGRYFGFRNSAVSLTNLFCVPIAGILVSAWPGGSIQGFGVVLLLGVIVGLISIGFQYFMADVNPQDQKQAHAEAIASPQSAVTDPSAAQTSRHFWHDGNFLTFLLYVSLWAFAVNLSAPFFNIYLLDNLGLDITWVTLYNSLGAGANLLLLVLWGKLADRIGNRPILISVGILVALTPVLWLATGANMMSIWLWFPLLHILAGGTWAAIDLCNNNLQLSVAPIQQHATYFAIAGALTGVSGALGATTGGLLVQFGETGGMLGLFALSSGVRLLALLPLVFVREQMQPRSLRRAMQLLSQSVQQRLGFPVRSPLYLKPEPVTVTVESGQDAAEISQNKVCRDAYR